MDPCDRVMLALGTGEALSDEDEAHRGACPRCTAASLAVQLGPAPLPTVAPPTPPEAAALNRIILTRQVARGVLVASVAAALVMVVLARPLTAETPPDMFAVLLDAEQALQADPTVPGGDLVAMLATTEPGQNDWLDTTDFLGDALFEGMEKP